MDNKSHPCLQNVSGLRRQKMNHNQSYSWGVKQMLMSGEGVCAMDCELAVAGQPTMVKPVAFKFMPVALWSALAWACWGAADGGGAWQPLPGAA
uniref:Uncharacterized protein n=1 Tax=Arundo donax TaxID=35708 RepID=A0A0A8YXL2_ARUDO